jgi:hypothetical protein
VLLALLELQDHLVQLGLLERKESLGRLDLLVVMAAQELLAQAEPLVQLGLRAQQVAQVARELLDPLV